MTVTYRSFTAESRQTHVNERIRKKKKRRTYKQCNIPSHIHAHGTHMDTHTHVLRYRRERTRKYILQKNKRRHMEQRVAEEVTGVKAQINCECV